MEKESIRFTLLHSGSKLNWMAVNCLVEAVLAGDRCEEKTHHIQLRTHALTRLECLFSVDMYLLGRIVGLQNSS